MTIFWVGLVVFLAVFTQSLSGFGSALVAMALLPAIDWHSRCHTTGGAGGFALEIVLIVRYRQSLDDTCYLACGAGGPDRNTFGCVFLVQCGRENIVNLFRRGDWLGMLCMLCWD